MRFLAKNKIQMNDSKLPNTFYQRANVVEIAKDLLGKYLFTNIENQLTAGMIVETEAYSGDFDKACHAHLNKRTKRTEIMFEQGGVAYIYLCYGIHHLFNIVTNIQDKADAVLIRAIEPKIGTEIMLQRRNMVEIKYNIAAGPGTMSKALGIDKSHYGTDLTQNLIWIEDKNIEIQHHQIIASPRIGIDYAEEDALLPWRFRIKQNPWAGK